MPNNEVEAGLKAELATHGTTCDCAHKKMCEDREEWLIAQLAVVRATNEVEVEVPTRIWLSWLAAIQADCRDFHAHVSTYRIDDSGVDVEYVRADLASLSKEMSIEDEILARESDAAQNAIAKCIQIVGMFKSPIPTDEEGLNLTLQAIIAELRRLPRAEAIMDTDDLPARPDVEAEILAKAIVDYLRRSADVSLGSVGFQHLVGIIEHHCAPSGAGELIWCGQGIP